jgi:hypothetical protein
MKGNISCCAACFEIETTIVLQLDSIQNQCAAFVKGEGRVATATTAVAVQFSWVAEASLACLSDVNLANVIIEMSE